MIVQNPPRLTLIHLDGYLRIEGWTPQLEAAFTTAGLQFAPDSYGYQCVHFDPSENQSLNRKLQWLAEHDVAFARDAKQTYDPAYTIKLLRDRGEIRCEFLTCWYDGQHWHVDRE